jgi:hypothetical protein
MGGGEGRSVKFFFLAIPDERFRANPILGEIVGHALDAAFPDFSFAIGTMDDQPKGAVLALEWAQQTTLPSGTIGIDAKVDARDHDAVKVSTWLEERFPGLLERLN